MRELELAKLSRSYDVRRLDEQDVPAILDLCKENILYYQHCPPYVTEESILADMKALPPHKRPEAKFYVGYFADNQLMAILEFILAYPDESTFYIGFFMTAKAIQNRGIGSTIIAELCAFAAELGFTLVKLGWVVGNQQAEHFWLKNGFTETGETLERSTYTAILAQRGLTL